MKPCLGYVEGRRTTPPKTSNRSHSKLLDDRLISLGTCTHFHHTCPSVDNASTLAELRRNEVQLQGQDFQRCTTPIAGVRAFGLSANFGEVKMGKMFTVTK